MLCGFHCYKNMEYMVKALLSPTRFNKCLNLSYLNSRSIMTSNYIRTV